LGGGAGERPYETVIALAFRLFHPRVETEKRKGRFKSTFGGAGNSKKNRGSRGKGHRGRGICF